MAAGPVCSSATAAMAVMAPPQATRVVLVARVDGAVTPGYWVPAATAATAEQGLAREEWAVTAAGAA